MKCLLVFASCLLAAFSIAGDNENIQNCTDKQMRWSKEKKRCVQKKSPKAGDLKSMLEDLNSVNDLLYMDRGKGCEMVGDAEEIDFSLEGSCNNPLHRHDRMKGCQVKIHCSKGSDLHAILEMTGELDLKELDVDTIENQISCEAPVGGCKKLDFGTCYSSWEDHKKKHFLDAKRGPLQIDSRGGRGDQKGAVEK